jgi:hypothetical protein
VDIKKYVEEYKNRNNHPSRHLQYLSGPSSLTFFTNIAGRRILLLGERHHNKRLCNANILKKRGAYEVQNWLIDVCSNANTCVDVLTESPYKYNIKLNCKGATSTANNTNNANNTNTNNIGNTLKDYTNPLYAVTCDLEELKKKGKLPEYMRYHNIDLRRYKDTVFPGTRLYELFVKDVATINEKEYRNIKNYYDKNKVAIISYLLGIDRSIYARSAYHNVIEMLLSLYGEELNKERNASLEKQYFASIDKEMRKIDEKDIPNKQRFLYTLLDIYLQENMFTSLMVPPMDLYLLLRLFVKFDENKMSRTTNPKGCRNSKVINNAIVYTGDAHTRIYRIFLEKYFNVFPSLVVGVGNKNQCLKLNDFDFFGGSTSESLLSHKSEII